MVGQPFNERVCTDDWRMGDAMCDGEVVAFSFPSKIDCAKFEGRHGVSLSLGCVEVKTEKGVDTCAISGGCFVVQVCEILVNFPNIGGFDKEEDSLERDVLVVLVNKLGPVSSWDRDKYVVK